MVFEVLLARRAYSSAWSCLPWEDMTESVVSLTASLVREYLSRKVSLRVSRLDNQPLFEKCEDRTRENGGNRA